MEEVLDHLRLKEFWFVERTKARKIHRGPIQPSSTESASISLMRELHVHKIRLLCYNLYQYYPKKDLEARVTLAGVKSMTLFKAGEETVCGKR